MQQVRLGVLALTITALLSGCGAPLVVISPKAPSPYAAKSAPVQLPSGQVPLAPVDPAPVSPAKPLPIAAASVKVLDTADMTDDEVAEDSTSDYDTQTLTKVVKNFEHTGMLRQATGGKLILEVKEGWIWKRKQVEYTLVGEPDVVYGMNRLIDAKVVVEGRVDSNNVVTVFSCKRILDFGAIFNFFTKGRIRGTVLDAKRWPIPGTGVTATRTTDGVFFKQTADENGDFQFRALEPGNYRVDFQQPGYATASVVVAVKKRKVVTLEGDL